MVDVTPSAYVYVWIIGSYSIVSGATRYLKQTISSQKKVHHSSSHFVLRRPLMLRRPLPSFVRSDPKKGVGGTRAWALLYPFSSGISQLTMRDYSTPFLHLHVSGLVLGICPKEPWGPAENSQETIAIHCCTIKFREFLTIFHCPSRANGTWTAFCGRPFFSWHTVAMGNGWNKHGKKWRNENKSSCRRIACTWWSLHSSSVGSPLCGIVQGKKNKKK